jgi:hypothetical protein
MRRQHGAEGGCGCASGGPERAGVTEALGSERCGCSGAQGMAVRWIGGGSCSAAPIDGGLMVIACRSGAEAEWRPRGVVAEVDHSEE